MAHGARRPTGSDDDMTALALDSVGAVRDSIRDAASRGVGLRIVGRGTWLDAGRPVRAGSSLSTRELAGIVDYVPGDLTLTARAGTALAEIREATAEHNQWLALDPMGRDDGSIGATVATASAGPLSAHFGTPRDLVLGLEYVTGSGTIGRCGGRVVKNVAGFDLTRLFTGSWGTLGVITEVTLRLHARPEADKSVAVPITGRADDLTRIREALRRFPFTPYACEVLNAPLARASNAGSAPIAVFRLGGNSEAVDAQRAALVEIGEPADIDGDCWTALRDAEPRDAFVFRLSRRPAEIGSVWTEAMTIADTCPGTLVHARPLRGVVRCVVPANASAVEALRQLPASGLATRIGERLNPDLWRASFPAAPREMDRQVKAAFDPDGVLNPGIFGELE
jgi:glycolate oxidase FAD binding subunit